MFFFLHFVNCMCGRNLMMGWTQLDQHIIDVAAAAALRKLQREGFFLFALCQLHVWSQSDGMDATRSRTTYSTNKPFLNMFLGWARGDRKALEGFIRTLQGP